jgi:hypothetical protein
MQFEKKSFFRLKRLNSCCFAFDVEEKNWFRKKGIEMFGCEGESNGFIYDEELAPTLLSLFSFFFVVIFLLFLFLSFSPF